MRRVAAFKLPELLLLESLPRNPVGKVLKSVLRERAGNGGPPGKAVPRVS